MEGGNKLNLALKYFGFDDNLKTKIIDNGANSNVYTIDDNKYILKFYRSDDNKPSRLEREAYALSLFKENKIHNVPKLIDKSKELNCILMTYIDGETVSDFDTSLDNFFVEFYKKILSIPLKYKINNFQSIDSCPSVDKLLNQINNRFINLERENNNELNYLLKTLKSLLKSIESNTEKKYYNDLKNEFSVVDFGINNILLNNNKVFFIDFEFFGLDNPVHLLSDTIAHPANNLNLENQLSLFDKLVNCHENKDEISKAFIGTNLIFDIKWCLIMLNPFLSSYTFNKDQNQRELKKKLQFNKVINKISLIEKKMKNEKFL